MATASRLLWSFARDNGVPFSGYISRVSLRNSASPSRISRDFEI
jgi:amino acid transporter